MHARHALRLTLLALGIGLPLAGASSALANTASSSNWSGYAVHRAGVKFRRVTASWTEPAAVCPNGQDTYSSFWVGLGGFNTNATGLEQTGTELDCTASGQQRISAWYELVPAPSRPISMTVRAGDELSASVTVLGHRVTFRLLDHTRGESFSKQLTSSSIDVTAADWIAEAPSTCDATGACQTLPLADYGSAHFTSAGAQTITGHAGTISDTAWNNTRLLLSQRASPFTGVSAQRTSTPSSLQTGGSAFLVRYGQGSGSASRRASASAARSGGAVQPGGARR